MIVTLDIDTTDEAAALRAIRWCLKTILRRFGIRVRAIATATSDGRTAP